MSGKQVASLFIYALVGALLGLLLLQILLDLTSIRKLIRWRLPMITVVCIPVCSANAATPLPVYPPIVFAPAAAAAPQQQRRQ